MRTMRRTVRFKRDLSARLRVGIEESSIGDLRMVVSLLAADARLPNRYRDHALAGDWQDHRDCHLRPDLVLIYRKPDAATLELVRLGSHSELSL
jgi:mRNA interferase YafQ